jgi:MoaA/NifB/PqqE/SkfB family radical SAM enzyme
LSSELFINLTYVCNERCVFCAADLKYEHGRERRWVTLDALRNWLSAQRLGVGDLAMLAGGEPTLHPQFLEAVRLVRASGPSVMLFSNGLRFENAEFAHETALAGVSWFEIALFGATARSHDGITKVTGSLERTLKGLRHLIALKTTNALRVVVRLLVSRQTHTENPDIIDLVRKEVGGVDAVSLNRLILSRSAIDSDAALSWDEARASINETAKRCREYGYELRFEALPLCVFDGENADDIRQQMAPGGFLARAAPPPPTFSYFDNSVAAGRPLTQTSVPELASPAPCRGCDYRSICTGVEAWYVMRFGTGALHTQRFRAPRGRVR